MVLFRNWILENHHADLSKSVNSPNLCWKPMETNQFHKNKRASNIPNQLNIPICEQSGSVIIDVVILIAVMGACGFLLYPYAEILAQTSIELGKELIDVVIEEVARAPLLFGCLGLSILFAAMALAAMTVCPDRNCGKQGCRGLRNAAEFDVQLETKESVKNSAGLERNGLRKGLFQLPRDQHSELEEELKKIAPPNGRAVLVFRARCGCSVGRMEVPGPRKSRKVKH